jgi:broad specificity phosphatase PhoE
MFGVTLVYLVQHGEKERSPGDPGLTELGRLQAERTGQWLGSMGVRSLWTSPLRRARETAACIASITGLDVRPDARLRERLNWDGHMSIDAFLALWAASAQDRDLVPDDGESSRQAAARLRAFLAGLPSELGPVAAVTHGGVTTDVLRDLLGDNALPPDVLNTGVPPCAVTIVDGESVLMIASTSHLT